MGRPVRVQVPPSAPAIQRKRLRAVSSAGRALPSHGRSRRFKSRTAHHSTARGRPPAVSTDTRAGLGRGAVSGNSSAGRALASQAKGRGFDPRFPLSLRSIGMVDLFLF